jgi:hypothetical protein
VPGPPAEPVTWYLGRDNQRYGPYSLPQLVKMAGAGNVQPGDLVWTEGMPAWTEARGLPELFPAGAPAGTGQHYLPGGAGRLLQPGAVSPAGKVWKFLWLQLRRAFARQLRSLPVSSREQERLSARGIDDETSQRYLVWRRSLFLVVAVINSGDFLLHLIRTAMQDYQLYSAFGIFSTIIYLLSQFALPVAAILAALFWAHVRTTRRIMVTGWAISFLVPLLLAFFPLSWEMRVSDLEASQDKLPEFRINVEGGLLYCFMILPPILSVVPGVMRACSRIKTFLPESIVPGWFLLGAALFYALLLLVVFITIYHLAGNLLLIFGIILWVGSPLVYGLNGGLLIRPLTDERDTRKFDHVEILYRSLVLLAVLLLVIYLLTVSLFGKSLVGLDSTTSWLRPWKILEFGIEFVGRSLFITTVFADFFMVLNWSVWLRSKQFEISDRAELYDTIMCKLAEYLRKK